jgi:hypothetical protein
MNKSKLDRRPKEEIQIDLTALDVIEELLGNEISSFALEDQENLFDEEFNEIIRKFEFSRGLKTHLVVIGPDGFIRWMSKGFPSILLQEIHNLLIIQALYQD